MNAVHRTRNRTKNRFAAVGATLGGAALIAGGVIQLTAADQVQTGESVETTIAHVSLAALTFALIALVPAVLELSAYARTRRPAYVATAGMLLLAVATTVSNVVGEDRLFFFIAAPAANLLWLVGSVGLALLLYRAGHVPRWLAIGVPLVQVASLPLSVLGGGILGGTFWLAVGYLIAVDDVAGRGGPRTKARRKNRVARALAATALLSLVAATPAAADSIAYVKDGNIWLTAPDGGRQHQVTRDGGYSYVSQADDGTLIAKHGVNIRRLDRVSGAVTADFATPVSSSPAGATFEFRGGPLDPVISPDGTRIAYGYNAQYTQYDPYCGYPDGCSAGKLIVGTGYSHADRLTAWDEPGFKQHSGWHWPAWIDNQRTLISDPAEILNKQFWIDTVGDDAHGQPWFHDDNNNPSQSDAEMNRQQTGMAAIVGNIRGREERIEIWKMNGPPPAEASFCASIDDPVSRFTSPSWSPSGDAMTYADGHNVRTVTGLDLAGCSETNAVQHVIVPGATAPDWGPADVPAGPTDCGGCGEKKVDRPKLALALTKGKAAKLGKALRRGLVLRVATGGAGKLTASARAKGNRVASGKARVGASGKGKLRLRFTAKARRKLRGARKVRLSVAVAFKASSGATARKSAVVTLRR
jgi:hypothetical protein